MTKTVVYGPTSTPVPDVTNVDVVVPPINFVADLGLLVDDPGVTIYDDKTSSADQPSTIRIAVRDNANVYGGTSIDPSAYLANRKGRDMVVKVQEVHRVDNSEDPDPRYYPISAAITVTAPISADVTTAAIEHVLGRALAAFAAQGADALTTGITALSHGITRK